MVEKIKQFIKSIEFISFSPLLFYFSLWGDHYGRELPVSLYEAGDGSFIFIYIVFFIILYKTRFLFKKVREKVTGLHLPFFYSTLNTMLIILNRQLLIERDNYDEYHLLIKITLAWCIALLIWFLHQNSLSKKQPIKSP